MKELTKMLRNCRFRKIRILGFLSFAICKKYDCLAVIALLLVLTSGCRMFVPEKDTTAEYELSPEIFFADPGKPVMSAGDIAYSEQQGASRAWLDNLKIPAFWQINGGINRKSLPLTLDFSGKRLRFSSPGSLSFYLRPSISPNHRYLLRFTMEGQGTVKAGYFTYPMPGKKGLSQMKEYRCTPDSSVITVEEVLDPTTEMGHRYFRLMFILSGELTLRDFCLKRLPLPEGETIAEGHLEAVSKLPVPEKSDYPDCYFTAKIRLEKILSGKPVPKEIQLAIPGFYGRKATEYAKFKSDDIVRVKLVKFDSLDDKRKSIQQADDLNIFDLENYFVIGAVKTNAVSPGENVIDFSGPVFYRSPWDHPVNPPVSEEAKAAKRAFIERDLKKLNAALSDIEGQKAELNRRFSEWLKKPEGCQSLEFDSRKYWWKNCNGAFFALPASRQQKISSGEISKENIEALKVLRDYLEVHGVQFMIQVIPDRFDIASRIMVPGCKQITDFRSALCVRSLLEAGIEAIYSNENLMKNYNKYELMFFYPNNEHPHDGCQDALTDLIPERLVRYGKNLRYNCDPKLFSTKDDPRVFSSPAIGGWPDRADIGRHSPGEPITHKEFYYNGKKLGSKTDSPILVIGNSHIQTPMEDSSYTAHLGLKTNIIAHDFRISALGPFSAIPLALFNDPERYLKGKSVCIFPIPHTFLTGKIKFLNLITIDRDQRLLNRKQIRLQLDCPVEAGKQPPSVPYKDFLKQFPEFRGSFFETAGKYDWGELQIPEKWRSKDSVIAMELIPFPRKEIVLMLNGEERKLPLSNQPSESFSFMFPVPAGTGSLKITLDCKQDNTAIVLKSVKLYQ